MKKLERPPKPVKLAMKEKELTEKYILNGKAVWRRRFIVKPLYKSSFGKCAYCENDVVWNQNEKYKIELDEDKQYDLHRSQSDENCYLHIDHYIPRKIDKNKVVDWENLIPCCPKCNYRKNKHNPNEHSIINPYLDDPKKYFIFYGDVLRVRYKLEDCNKDKANNTIALFGFSTRLPSILKTHKYLIDIQLQSITLRIDDAIKKSQENNCAVYNLLIDDLEGVLTHGLPNHKYSSFLASFILYNPTYLAIKAKLLDVKQFPKFIDDLENKLKKINYELQDD